MTAHELPLDAARIDAWLPPGWGRRALRERLQVIAEAVHEVAGFGVVAIGVCLESEELELMAVAGSEQARADLLGSTTSTRTTRQLLSYAEEWGLLRFVPHEVARSWRREIWTGADQTVPDDPGAWHPYDLLLAPVLDTDGTLLGVLSFDRPADGRRPGAQSPDSVAAYVDQASEAIRTALERDRLAEHVRLTDAVRRVVRTATTRLPLDRLLPECARALEEAFGVDVVRLETMPVGQAPGHTATVGWREGGAPQLRELVQELARRCWSAQRVAVVDERRQAPGLLEPDEHALLTARLAELGLASAALVPLGVGTSCLGWAALCVRDAPIDWRDAEAAAALDIGHDLGRAVLQSERLQRDELLTAQLAAASEAKTRLISTVAHELKNPLGAILGHVELLEDAAAARPPGFATSLGGVQRSADRMRRMVEELLVLARLEERPAERLPVDVRDLVAAAVDRYAALAAARAHAVQVVVPEAPVLVEGSAADLQRAVDALVENALSYSESGTAVRLCAGAERRSAADGRAPTRRVAISCTDRGYGISEADRAGLFTEFFRTSNPRALAQPGTGLGLAIAARVARAHGGEVAVESEPGRGSTFRLLLPPLG